jgi:VirE N-terminal domain/Primase C terminal 1 (PriCT-1)
MLSIFKNLYKSKDVPYYVTIEKVVDRIKNGTSKAIIEKLNSTTDPEEQKEIKNSLPCILFAGKFSERNAKSLIEHSGLCVIDFDKIPSEEMSDMFNKITSNPHILLCFKSPSRSGFKAVVKIPKCDKDLHIRYFKGFQSKFNFEYFDIKNSNVDRVCFESYDPNIYHNPNAQIFTDLIEDEGYSVSEKTPVLPLTEEGKIIENLLKWWNKKYGFVKDSRNNNVFILACAFCEYGISQETAINFIWGELVIYDASNPFTESECNTTVKSAYKKAQFGCKYFENVEKLKSLKIDIKSPNKDEVIKKYSISEETYNEIKGDVEHDDFWFFTDDKKPKLKIDSLKFKFFLERNGFKKYFPADSEEPNFIFIESNKVVDTSTDKIKDFVLTYLLQRGEKEVWNYCSTSSKLFSDDYLSMLETIELLMLRDSKDISYIAFNNGIVEVNQGDVKLRDYIDIEGYIWKKQIINREFCFSECTENDYKTFIEKVSGGTSLPIECIIGYFLSTYKNKMNNKAIILNDEVISENPEGGTGKGLFIQGISQIRRVAILDGKTFDDKKSFPYQTVSPDTQVLVFDDVVKNFSFENKFSLVTEGMTLERKNKDAVKLSVSESPKIAISTNYAIKGEGNSHDRRRFEVEFAQYFGRKKTPFEEFKRQLFDDWNAEDYVKFDNYMIQCLQSYLKLGLVEQTAKNLKMRKFIAETSMEFYEWINNENENFEVNTRHDKSSKFDSFINEYQDYKKWLSRKKFQQWVEKYAHFKGYDFMDGNTNGSRWFMIKSSEETIKESTSDIPF